MVIDEVRSSTVPPGGESPTSQSTRFTARQPILNNLQHVIGYELLFRTGWENCFRGESDDATGRFSTTTCLPTHCRSRAIPWRSSTALARRWLADW